MDEMHLVTAMVDMGALPGRHVHLPDALLQGRAGALQCLEDNAHIERLRNAGGHDTYALTELAVANIVSG
eukprot:5376199-Alexandrium_andersonii.AAC.1